MKVTLGTEAKVVSVIISSDIGVSKDIRDSGISKNISDSGVSKNIRDSGISRDIRDRSDWSLFWETVIQI